jgi:transcriptional regulator with XRE-family HTH domain
MLTTQEQRIILGQKIKELREAKGMTQGELAKKAGFAGRAAISNIEKAHSGINVGRLPDLARALGVDPLVLFDNDKQPDFTMDGVLIEKFKRLDSKERMQIEAMIDVLLKNRENP